ncbi:hypothetical protein [Ectopseudomonas mendocina]|uniref:hypothetical protein n=1 Tax=Ectopseudomonas mendocina TaxID=300 RepID=UPI0011D1CBCF|nr:hypothetical protein [Pseudomonas mendocina]
MPTTAQLPGRFQQAVETIHLTYAVHELLPTHSQRQISQRLGISRRRVAGLASTPRPFDMSTTTEPTDFWTREETAPTMKRSDTIDAILALAIRPEGVRYAEYAEVLRACFGVDNNGGLNMTEAEHRQLRADVKRKARTFGKTAVFVPAWIAAHDPKGSHRAMLEAAHCVYETIEHAALAFAQEFPGVSFQAVMRELRCLAVPGFSSEPLGQRLERINSVVDQLAGHPLDIAGQLARPVTTRVPEMHCIGVARDDSELARLCL